MSYDTTESIHIIIGGIHTCRHPHTLNNDLIMVSILFSNTAYQSSGIITTTDCARQAKVGDGRRIDIAEESNILISCVIDV